MKEGSSNTGNRRSPLCCPKTYLASGHLKVRLTCMSLKRYALISGDKLDIKYVYSQNLLPRVSPFLQIRLPSSHSPSPTDKSAYFLSSPGNSLESTMSRCLPSKRCSRPERLYSRWTIWSSVDGLRLSENWSCLTRMERFLEDGVVRYGMRVGHLYCIQLSWA